MSPIFYVSRYIRQMLEYNIFFVVGCMICGTVLNILTYADDVVLLSPSWKALHMTLYLLREVVVNRILEISLY